MFSSSVTVGFSTSLFVTVYSYAHKMFKAQAPVIQNFGNLNHYKLGKRICHCQPCQYFPTLSESKKTLIMKSVETILFIIVDETSGLQYKHMKIVNYASSVVNKLEALLTGDARVVIYERHVFIVQATGFAHFL